MVAERAGLLLELPECALDSESVTVKLDDVQGFQIQTGACQYTLLPAHFYKDKPQFLVQLLVQIVSCTIWVFCMKCCKYNVYRCFGVQNLR